MTREQALSELRELMVTIGGGYHPDTPMSDYVNTQSGLPSFTGTLLSELAVRHNNIWIALGDSIYDEAVLLHSELFF